MQGVRDRWWLIVLTVLVCTGATQAMLSAAQPLYETSTTFSVTVVTGDGDTRYSSGASNFVSTRAKSYAALMQRPSFRDAVVNRLPGPPSTDQYPRLDTVLIENTDLLQVTVTDTNAQRAFATSALTAEVLPELAASIDPVGSAGNAPVQVRAVEEPVLADTPVGVNSTGYRVGSFLLGALLGIAGAVLLTRIDGRVRRVRDLQRAGEPPALLGSVPRKTESKGMDTAACQEAFGTIYARLLYYAPSTPRFVLITSAVHGEGKTLVAARLAETAARSGQRVLVLGCDLRHPDLVTTMGVTEGAGLVGVLLEGVPRKRAIVSTDIPGLDVLSAGKVTDHPLRVITDPALGHLLDDLRTEYDLVVIDTPPVLAVADAALLAGAADATIVVTRLKRVRLAQLNLVREQLDQAGAVIVGTVVTGARRREVRYSALAGLTGSRPRDHARRSPGLHGVRGEASSADDRLGAAGFGDRRRGERRRNAAAPTQRMTPVMSDRDG